MTLNMNLTLTFRVVAITVTLLLFNNVGIKAISIERDLTLTSHQKGILDEFRESVNNLLPHDYMKKDIYLVRWLRARSFDMKSAKKMLLDNLQWREQNDMDHILETALTKSDKDYPHVTNGFDREGRPVVETWVRDYNLRAAAIAGNMDGFVRSLNRAAETVTKKIRQLQDEGKNVTQYYHIYDLNDFNLVQHGCPACISGIVQGIHSYEIHYPGSGHKSVLINVPAIFEPVLQAAKAAMSPRSAEMFFVFGRNKRNWRKFILNDIENDQLSYRLGGTLIMDPENGE